jgi:hypothetical protein
MSEQSRTRIVDARGMFLASWFSPPARAACLASAACYRISNIASSIWVAWNGGWRFFPGLVLAYGIMHFAYGIGLLAGLFSLGRAGESGARDMA